MHIYFIERINKEREDTSPAPPLTGVCVSALNVSDDNLLLFLVVFFLNLVTGAKITAK